MVSVASNSAAAAVSIEKRTIQKLRTRIIPFIFVLYIVAFIDRINIGFAALTMNKELVITSPQYGFDFGIFFFGYFIFEIPSNLLLHKIGARIWIARILITWGIIAALAGLVRNVLELYSMRFLLGLRRPVLRQECCCISPTGFASVNKLRQSLCSCPVCRWLVLSVPRFRASSLTTRIGLE